MRWFRSPSRRGPSVGDIRLVRRFLWWPMELFVPSLDKMQVRWLEWAIIHQQYVACPTYDNRDKCCWRSISFQEN
jgi:hypothetical protein